MCCAAKAIAVAIRDTLTLETLILKSTVIKGKGCLEIAEALRRNRSLTKLDLSDNEIDDEGGAALARAISTTQTLQSVDLSLNKIGEQGGLEMAAALAAQPPLQTLLLNNNKYVISCFVLFDIPVLVCLSGVSLRSIMIMSRLNDVVGAALVKALKTNTLILQLGIELNSISYGVRDMLEYLTAFFSLSFHSFPYANSDLFS